MEYTLFCYKYVKKMNVKIEASWQALLSDEFEKPYFQEILSFLECERKSWKIIYPEQKNIFTAFEYTPVDKLKVVILGQDPYHGAGQAHGLSFSVQKWAKIPPSLKNIYKELENEWFYGTGTWLVPVPSHGNLTHWADQGVLLLNSILTVEAWKPASHWKIGWENFTDSVIEKISENCDGIIFLLWGNFARSKKALIDEHKHHILESPHPSPFSAHRGFLWNNHFKKVNEIISRQGKKNIKW
jgi:uracil-DNA glycosylase